VPPKYALKELPPCPGDSSDERVEQDGPYWDLRTIQAALKDGALEWMLTPTADEDRRNELRFDEEDLHAFMQQLHAGCCKKRASQWCVEPRQVSVPDKRVSRLADVYVMGFQRATRKAQPGGYPGIYIKFSVSDNPKLLIIYSFHFERPEDERNARKST
jgi:hypothetical protein